MPHKIVKHLLCCHFTKKIGNILIILATMQYNPSTAIKYAREFLSKIRKNQLINHSHPQR